MTSINAIAAATHRADLHRAASSWRTSSEVAAARNDSERPELAVVLRRVGSDEAGVVSALADLDDAAPLAGEVLLALVDGEAVAAISLQDRRVVANPFVATEQAVALLRLRADHLLGSRPRRRRRHVLRPRLAI